MIRILLVDDRAFFREVLKTRFEKEDDFYIVGNAENGQIAIEQVEVLQPDIVLMDIEMPEMDGVAATEIINQRFAKVKVIVLSANDNYDYLARALQAGAEGYLLKGAEQEEIVNTIRSVYRGYKQFEPRLLEKMIDFAQTDKQFREYVEEAKFMLEDISQAEKRLEKKLSQLQTQIESRLRKIQEELLNLEQQADRSLENIPKTKKEFERYLAQLNNFRNYLIIITCIATLALLIAFFL